MKLINKWLVVMTMLVGLVACSSSKHPDVDWNAQSNLAVSLGSNQTIKLQLVSNLWFDMMPRALDDGEPQNELPQINGSLYLLSKQEIPPELSIDKLIISSEKKYWELDLQQVDVDSHSPEKWQILFQWPAELEVGQRVDVALQLHIDDQAAHWMVERGVRIDSVH